MRSRAFLWMGGGHGEQLEGVIGAVHPYRVLCEGGKVIEQAPEVMHRELVVSGAPGAGLVLGAPGAFRGLYG